MTLLLSRRGAFRNLERFTSVDVACPTKLPRCNRRGRAQTPGEVSPLLVASRLRVWRMISLRPQGRGGLDASEGSVAPQSKRHDGALYVGKGMTRTMRRPSQSLSRSVAILSERRAQMPPPLA